MDEIQLLKEWKERLGLNDWFIVMETDCDPSNIEIADCDGCASYIEETKSARIQIVDEKLRKGAIRPFSFEETLVHELLHLKFGLLDEDDDKSLRSRFLHVLIDDIARALVDAKYSKKKG